MISGDILRMDVPHRETISVRGFLFGKQSDQRTCAIVGSTRGNEVQQAFICATVVRRLTDLERKGALAPGKSILVIPCANPYAMNVLSRFWPADNTDINRQFPGDAEGETTQRIAAGIMRVVSTYRHGVQLSSFYQPGDFLPHVRITRVGQISDEGLAMAKDFGLPYALMREASPIDATMLNYAWQIAGTHAFSLYSRATDRIDERSAFEVADAVIRFLVAREALVLPTGETVAKGQDTAILFDHDLVEVRCENTAGYLVSHAQAGEHVSKGAELAQVRDAFDARILETLYSPVSGRIFFMSREPLASQHMVIFRIAPDTM